MQYVLLIYSSETANKARPPTEAQAITAEYMTYTMDIKKSGHMLGGEALEPTSVTTTVRVREGKVLKTDGPFAETREQLGGFYLVEAKDLDEAVALAARIPDSRSGCIEVRPVIKYPR